VSRGRIISMTVSTGDGYFVAMVDTGRVRVGQRGGACYEFPIVHPKAREAMALTESTVRAFHSACESLPFQYNMTPSTGEPGYRLPLFHALDSADLVSIDGVELMPRYRELTPARRLVRLANEEDLTIDDQEVRIVSGVATFTDVDGIPHQVRFSVERELDAATTDPMLA
jgi:hypothetical protein